MNDAIARPAKTSLRRCASALVRRTPPLSRSIHKLVAQAFFEDDRRSAGRDRAERAGTAKLARSSFAAWRGQAAVKKKHRSSSVRYLTRVRQEQSIRDARQRKRLRGRLHDRWRAVPERRVVPAGPSRAYPPVAISAPEVFDLVREPEYFLSTFDRIEHQLRRGRVPLLDFTVQTQAVSPDALLSMLALGIRLSRKYSREIRLRLPTDPVLAAAFENSGVMSYLRGVPPTTRDVGMIRRRQSRKVEPETAQDLIIFATKTLFGERRREYGSYSTFIECMGNTFEHSDKEAEGEELWWASIYCNVDVQKAQCAFVDTGIGIFDSVVYKGIVRKLRGVLQKAISKPDVLRELLERKIGSRTGESYRNRGLPRIYKDAQSGAIRNLVIITDRVYADIEREVWRTLNRPFRGTFYYWEFTT